jgi:hypothetical protein
LAQASTYTDAQVLAVVSQLPALYRQQVRTFCRRLENKFADGTGVVTTGIVHGTGTGISVDSNSGGTCFVEDVDRLDGVCLCFHRDATVLVPGRRYWGRADRRVVEDREEEGGFLLADARVKRMVDVKVSTYVW